MTSLFRTGGRTEEGKLSDRPGLFAHNWVPMTAGRRREERKPNASRKAQGRFFEGESSRRWSALPFRANHLLALERGRGPGSAPAFKDDLQLVNKLVRAEVPRPAKLKAQGFGLGHGGYRKKTGRFVGQSATIPLVTRKASP